MVKSDGRLQVDSTTQQNMVRTRVDCSLPDKRTQPCTNRPVGSYARVVQWRRVGLQQWQLQRLSVETTTKNYRPRREWLTGGGTVADGGTGQPKNGDNNGGG